MYRKPDRPAAPPTLIEFHSKLVRFRAYPLAALLLAFAFGALGSVHATHVVCPPAGDVCVVARYALPTFLRDVEVPVADIVDVDVEIRRGSKGGKYAIAKLRTRGDAVNLSGGLFGRHDPAAALAAKARFHEYLTNGRATGLDLWITPSPVANVVLGILGVAVLFLVFAVLRDQLRQLRPVRILIDHDRDVVQIGGREVRIDEIASVDVDHGRALYWASGKNEHIPGFRIVVTTASGARVPATREYRAGDEAVHKGARTRLLSAIGRPES